MLHLGFCGLQTKRTLPFISSILLCLQQYMRNGWHQWWALARPDSNWSGVREKISISTSTKRSKHGTANHHTLELNKSHGNNHDEHYLNFNYPNLNFHFQVLSRAGGWFALIATGKSFRWNRYNKRSIPAFAEDLQIYSFQRSVRRLMNKTMS